MIEKCCDGMIHTVREGDTLYTLSKKYDVPLVSILRANPYVDIYNLGIGSRICIPCRKMHRNADDEMIIEENEEKMVREMPPDLMAYVVQEGDSLGKILEDNNMSPHDFLKLNNMEDILLKRGITVMVVG